MNIATENNEILLGDLVSRWQHRHAQREAFSLSELCCACPELLPELERQLAASERMRAGRGNARDRDDCAG